MDVPVNNIEASQNNSEFIFDEICVDIDWGVLRGKKIGSGTRKVLAVHGWLDNANSFDLVIPYLRNDTTIISIDLPGHGLSDHFPPGTIYEPYNYLGALKKLVLKLKWSSFTLLTHSLGAVVGIIYCAVFPEDVNAFISIDIIKPWSLQPENYASTMKKYFLSYFKNEDHSNSEALEYEEEELIQKTIAGSNSLDPASAKILLQRGSKLTSCGEKRILTRDLRAKAYFIGFLEVQAWFEFAKAITCPTLLIKAKDGRNYDNDQNNENMKEAFKKGSLLYQYIEVEGKHHIHLTNSKVVGPILQEFFQQSLPFLKPNSK